MKNLRMSKFNWMVIVIILLGFLVEYHFLNEQFEQKSAINLKNDFKVVVSGVSGLTNNFDYGSSITKYRVETLSRQILRYNINYVDEKVIGSDSKDSVLTATSVRKVMESEAWDHFIIMGLYDHQTNQFLLSEGYFDKASSLPKEGIKDLIKAAVSKEEAFKSFPLGKSEDLFNRVDVFARYNKLAAVTLLGAIPRENLKEAYEDNIDFKQLRSELVAHHSPKNEGYIFLYDKKGTLLADNVQNNGDNVFLNNTEGKSLYNLVIKQQEEVLAFNAPSKGSDVKSYYVYGDRSGSNLIVVMKEKEVADKHKAMVQIIVKITTALMILLMLGLIYLVHDAKPKEDVVK